MIINVLQGITLKKSIIKKLTQVITLVCFTCLQITIPYQLALANTIPGLIPDGSTNTTTDLAPNGVPINNIAAPSSAGVSLNNWYEYSVSEKNQVVNNRKGGTVNTNLAGEIYGNPHFNASGASEARIIVQQVTSTNPTNLFGYIEVAGGRAELVIANPNQINIAGAGFINVSRLTLVNGKVNMGSNGEIADFKISNQNNGPGIIITGVNTPNYVNLGLDASKVEYADIIARSVLVAGDIHVKNKLNFRLGNDSYDYNSKTIKSTNDPAITNSKPIFALDSSYLGGMYADSVSLIISEIGAGVRIRGDLVSNAAEIDFNVKGDLAYKRIDAKTNLNLNIEGNITQSESDTADSKESPADNPNSKPSLAKAGGDININANNIALKEGSFKANNIFINSNNFTNQAIITAANSLQINNIAAFKNSNIIEARQDAIFNSGSFADNNQIIAKGNLTINANNGISYNNLYSGKNLNITNNNSGDINHNYKSYSLGTTTITNKNGNIIIGLNKNSNSGSLYSQENLILNSNLNIINNSDIFSKAKINLSAQNLTNNMRIMALGNKTGESSDLTINLDGNLLNYGSLYANDNINLNIDGNITNDASNNNAGEIFALNGDININGKIYNTNYGNISKYDLFNLAFDKSESIWFDLVARGYIDANGKITDKFKNLSSESDMALNADLIAYRGAIYQALSSLNPKLNPDHLHLVNRNFDNQAQNIYNILLDKGYIDENGKILAKFTDAASSASSDLADDLANDLDLGSNPEINYLKNDIYQILANNNSNNELVTINSFKQINKSLDNSAARLLNQLTIAGYLNEKGQKTASFDFADEDSFAAAFGLVANGGEYEVAKTAIFNTLKNQDSSHQFQDNDFLGDSFDSHILFNENQILINNLLAKGYISNNGDIKQAFYDLGGNYSNLDLDPRFSNFKEQIGTMLAQISPDPTIIAKTNLAAIAKNNTKDQAEKIFNKMISKGYLNNKGDFTQKLADEVINYQAATDNQKAHQLQLDEFNNYAFGIFLQIKAKNGSTIIKNTTTKLENLNGAKISSALGSINIKALTFNNLAKDDKDVIKNKESAYSRTEYRNLSYPWKNTALWGYDQVERYPFFKQTLPS